MYVFINFPLIPLQIQQPATPPSSPQLKINSTPSEDDPKGDKDEDKDEIMGNAEVSRKLKIELVNVEGKNECQVEIVGFDFKQKIEVNDVNVVKCP